MIMLTLRRHCIRTPTEWGFFMWYYRIMQLGGRLRRLYFMQVPENADEYKKSRSLMIAEGSIGILIFLMVSGPILAGFFQFLGVSDSLNGILSSLPVLISCVQPLCAIVVERLRHRKPYVVGLAMIQRCCYITMFFVPSFIHDTTLRVVFVAVLFGMGYLLSNLFNPANNNWLIDLTPKEIRGKYFSTKEATQIFVSSALAFVMGLIIDQFKAADKMPEAYIMMGILLAIAALASAVIMSMCKEPPVTTVISKKIPLWKIITMPIRNKNFIPVFISIVIWNIANQMATPYLQIYLISDLQRSYTFVMVATIIAAGVKMFSLRFWGRIADRTGWSYVTRTSLLFIGLGNFACFFLNINNVAWFYILCVLLSNIGWASYNMAFFNLQYERAPEEGRSIYIASTTAIAGLCAFGSAFIGGFIVDYVKTLQLTLFNAPLSGQQILLAVNGIILVLLGFYIKKALPSVKPGNNISAKLRSRAQNSKSQ